MPEGQALDWGQIIFYCVAYAVGLSAICVAVLTYAYLASAWFTSECLSVPKVRKTSTGGFEVKN